MIVYLDANVVIYFIEQPSVWGSKAAARIGTSRTRGDRFAISDLTRMECQVKPLAHGNAVVLGRFAAFFSYPDVQVLSIAPAVFDRAALIRATHQFKALDALHLAAAVTHGCDTFLTHDQRLGAFPDIAVEVLS